MANKFMHPGILPPYPVACKSSLKFCPIGTPFVAVVFAATVKLGNLGLSSLVVSGVVAAPDLVAYHLIKMRTCLQLTFLNI